VTWQADPPSTLVQMDAQRWQKVVFGLLVLMLVVLVWTHGFYEVGEFEGRPITSESSVSADEDAMKVVCFGDSHGRHRQMTVPDGDVLIFTGDCTDPKMNEIISKKDQEAMIKDFDDWLGTLPHKYKFVVAGNHDAEHDVELADLYRKFTNARYLEDEKTEIPRIASSGTVKIYGTPWQSQFEGYETFLPEGSQLRKKFSQIPQDTMILVTHSPPNRHFDRDPSGKPIGSKMLLNAVRRVNPDLHCFGHVHAGRSKDMMDSQSSSETTVFVNGAVCNDDLVLTWDPVVVYV